MESFGTETVDQIAESLPGHHFDKRVRHEVDVLGIDVAILNVGQRVWELDRGSVRKPVASQRKFGKHKTELVVREHHM